jgi:hypothetical protein
MRSCLVEVHHIFIEDTLELPLMKDQQMIEAFLPHTPQEAFTDGIGSGCVIRRFEDLDRARFRHTSKARPKLPVVITNQILGCLPIRGRFSELLGHPGIGRRSSDPDMDHPSRLQFYDEGRKERVLATWIIRSKTGTSRRKRSSSPACKHRRVGVQSEVVNSIFMLERHYSHVMEKLLVWLEFFPLSSG